MKTLLYANRAEPKSISVISILLLAAVGDITKLRCMHRECYIFASQNLWLAPQQTIYSTLLDAMRLKVPELIRHFDDNLSPKASNCSIVLWTLLRPKASN